MRKKGEDNFKLVKRLVEAGDFTTIEQVAEFVTVTHLAIKSHLAYSTLHDKVANPQLFRVDDFIKMGKVLDLSPLQLITLVMNSINKKVKVKSKVKK